MNKAKTILFIEDEEELLNTIGNLLRDIGYEVMAVLDAEDGLMKIEETTPDLILADIKLPGIDGFAFFKQVKQDKRFAAGPVGFLSALNQPKTKRFAEGKWSLRIYHQAVRLRVPDRPHQGPPSPTVVLLSRDFTRNARFPQEGGD